MAFLVLFRPGTASVRSGLVSFFVPEPEHVICLTKSWCAAHGGRWGVVRERVRTADERRSVPNTWHPTTGCLKQSQLPHPTGRATDRPSTLLLMTLGFQEPAGCCHADTPRYLGTHQQCYGAGHPQSYPPTAAAVVGLNREDVEWAKYRSNNVGLWHGAEAAML